MAQLNDLIVTGKSRFLNDISGTVEKAKAVDDDFINTLGIFTDANAGPIQVVTDDATVVPLLFTGSTAYSTLGSGFKGRAFYLNGVFFGAVIDDIYFKVYVDSGGSISSTISFNQYANSKNLTYQWSFVDGSNSSSYNSTEGYFNTSDSFSTATPIPSFDGITVNWSISGSPGVYVSASSSSSSSGYANKYFYFKNPKKIYAFSTYSLPDKNLITYGTSDMTAGTSNLTTGTIYCMYEA